MSVEDMPDERLLHYYESVRQQVEADRAGNYTFMMNPTTQQYADRLQSEMIKRGFEHLPIPWPPEMARKHLEVVDEDGQQESDPGGDWKLVDDRCVNAGRDSGHQESGGTEPSLSGTIRSL